MSLSRNALGMQHVAEVLCPGVLAENHAAKLADLSSKSCIPVQQILLVCHIKTPPAGRSFRVSFAHLGAICNVWLEFLAMKRQVRTAWQIRFFGSLPSRHDHRIARITWIGQAGLRIADCVCVWISLARLVGNQAVLAQLFASIAQGSRGRTH